MAARGKSREASMPPKQNGAREARRSSKIADGLKLRLDITHTVPGIEPGDLVGFGERRIVEGILDEIFDGALQVEHGLADVHEFGRAFADDVDAEEAARLQGEDQF